MSPEIFHVFVRTSFSAGVVPEYRMRHAPVPAGDLDGIGPSYERAYVADGAFESHLAITVSETQWAIRRVVEARGGGGVGALRARECAPDGMKGVSIIASFLAASKIVDDGDLAVAMTAGSDICSAPIVNLECLCALLRRDKILETVVDEYWRLGSDIHFSIRTHQQLSNVRQEHIPFVYADHIAPYLKPGMQDSWDLKRRDFASTVRDLASGTAQPVCYQPLTPEHASMLLSDLSVGDEKCHLG